MRYALLAVAALSGCIRETQKSRDFLNCVYQQEYVQGQSRAVAENACRRTP